MRRTRTELRGWMRLRNPLRAPRIIGRFFSTERSLDRPRMYLDAELLPEQLRQLPSPDRLARNEPLLQKCQDLALDLVRAAWTSLLGHDTRDSCPLQVCLGLIVGRPRDTIVLDDLGYRSVLDRDTAQHLVLDLHQVAGIEELALPKLRIEHFLGRRIERALFAEDWLSTVAVVLLGM